MGGKAKWRKLKRVVGPTPQGTQAPAKQHFKKERTKTRDAKRRRMGDAGEEDDDEADAKAEGAKKESKPPKDTSAKASLKKGQDTAKGRGQTSQKSTGQAGESETGGMEDLKDSKASEEVVREANGVEESVTEARRETNGVEDSMAKQTPHVMVTDLDKDLDSPVIEGLQKPTSEETLKEELRKATEDESPRREDEQQEGKPGGTADAAKSTAYAMSEDLIGTQKSTQTDAVNINNSNGEKPVKFFISDEESDSDTAIFVDAHQAAPNSENGQLQDGVVSRSKRGDEGIEISAVIDAAGESTVEVTVERRDVEAGNEDSTGSPVVTQLIDVESSESPKSHAVQRAKYLPSLAQPVKTETQKMHGNIRRPHGPTKFPFDHLVEGDNVSRSSASDSVDTTSATRSSVSDLADPDNISKTSTSESADQDEQRKFSTSDSVDLDTTSVTSTNESIEHETVSKVSVTESAEQETMTISTAESIDADVPSKLSTVESAEPGSISKSSTRGSIDQDIISKSSASESCEPDVISKTSASESGEPEYQSKTSYSEYEEAEGVTRTSASESGEQDSASRTSVSESGDGVSTSRTSVSESAEGTSKTSMTATGTSASATGEYMSSKSSVSCSSEFDAESLSSTADLLTPKEEISFASDVKAEPGSGESAKLEKESPTGSPEATESATDRPGSPGWEELNLEDQMQLTHEGVSEDAPPKSDKDGSEADAESLFFSLYPEYQPGEVDESQLEALKKTAGNPKVLCFRGQTPEQGETQEEIYMAAEKREAAGIKDGRNKGTVSGKIHQLQRKLSQPKKLEREDKEVTELEGSATQQTGISGSEQQNIAEQKTEGGPEQGGPEPSSDPTRRKPLSDVPDSSSPSSTVQATDAKTPEHPFSKAADNLVCFTGQLGERVEGLIEATEIISEVVTDILQDERRTSEGGEVVSSGAEVGQEALEADSKLEGNAKDRKTLVGKARDWIKGVTRMGGKKDDTNDKGNEKGDGKKSEADGKADSERKKSTEKAKENDESKDNNHKGTEQGGDKEKEEPSAEEEESDSTGTKDNGGSADDQAAEMKTAEADEMENLKNVGKDTENGAIGANGGGDNKDEVRKDNTNGDDTAGKEKAETEATKETAADEEKAEREADQTEPDSKEEELFDIVSPEEELSDSVFKDENGDENGKAKETDDTEVHETDDLPDHDTEKDDSAEVANKKGGAPSKDDVNVDDGSERASIKDSQDEMADAVSQVEADETVSKESEASFVSVQEAIEPEIIPTTRENLTEATSEVVAEKRRKTAKDELKPRRKRHDKSKSPSASKEAGNEDSPKVSRREKDGKSVSKKRRHRRRTKSQEDTTDPQAAALQETDAAHNTEDPRPEDVALPQDDFENENDPSQQKGTENCKNVSEADQDGNSDKKEIETTDPHISDTVSQDKDAQESQPPTEKKRASSKSSKEKKHSRKSDEQTEHKRHSRSRREKSLEPKHEKHDTEKQEKVEGSPREKLQSESEVQSSFTATAATWSPRVGRKDRKTTRKSSDRKRDGQSSDRPKGSRDKKDESEHTVSSKASSDFGEDASAKKSPKTPRKVKSKKPELSISITEPREDTPIPSPKSQSQQFKLDSSSAEKSVKPSAEPQPLLQVLTFPEGVSKPISPLPPTKEFKFPAGVSKPISPLDKKRTPFIIPKPIPAPLILKPDVEPSKLLSPIKSLTFPEGVSKPQSPLPKRVPQIPKTLPSTVASDTPLPYPAKPVSPLKMLHFPEGITKPLSPTPPTTEESAFKAPSVAPKDVPSVSEDQESKTTPPSLKTDIGEASKPESPPLKKPKPRISIPTLEPTTSAQAPDAASEPAKPVSPLKVLKFPEGISKPVSPLIQKGQQAVFKLDTASGKTVKPAHEPLNLEPESPKPVPDSTKSDLPMRVPAKPLSPLRKLIFPPGISKPVSPTPPKISPPLFKPIVDSKPLPPSLTLDKPSDEVSKTDSSQLDKKVEEPSSTASQILKTRIDTLATLTFPEGVSKPKSPLPQKTKFYSEAFKTTQAPTKPPSPTSELFKTTSAASKPKPSTEIFKPPLIPSEFFKTVHDADEKPMACDILKTIQGVSKSASLSKDLLKISETDSSSKPSITGRTSPVRTFKFPEGVSMPVSPLPAKGRSAFGAPQPHSLAQKVQAEQSVAVSSTQHVVKTPQESSTVFSFPQIKKDDSKTEETPKSSIPTTPTLQKVRPSSVTSPLIRPSAEATSPAPIKIKHFVDFPSDSFPCTKSPVTKTASSPLAKPTSPVVKTPTTEPASPLVKTTTSVTKVTEETEIILPELPSPVTQSQTKFPKSILSTKVRSPIEICKVSSDQTSKTQPESIKSPLKLPSNDFSPKIQPETTKSAISQTHLTYSEVSKRFTPSPRMADEMSKEIISTPPMTPPADPEQPSSPSVTAGDKPLKKPSAAAIQTSEVRSAAKYSRGEESQPSQKSRGHEACRPSPDVSRSRHEESRSPKEGSPAPHAGLDSPSKKLRRRKRR